MNYISTWFCEDEVGQESVYHQTGQVSSSDKHKNIYWRCIYVFYLSSIRVNSSDKHLFFTNTKCLPVVDGLDFQEFFKLHDIEVIHTDFKYRTPKGYYGAWRNQFYEFSILEYISKTFANDDDSFMILDSDCIFMKSCRPAFELSGINGGFLSYEIPYTPDIDINGLTRTDMKEIYQDLLGRKIESLPPYNAGEFLLLSLRNIRFIMDEFKSLWPTLLIRNEQGLKKFNEEAHTLSFLFFKAGLKPGGANKLVRRLWTNPVFLRNIKATDVDLAILHLPSEKTFGFPRLFLQFKTRGVLDVDDATFRAIIKRYIGFPDLNIRTKLPFYYYSYLRAIRKRMRKVFSISK